MGANIIDLRGIAMERMEARLDVWRDTHVGDRCRLTRTSRAPIRFIARSSRCWSPSPSRRSSIGWAPRSRRRCGSIACASCWNRCSRRRSRRAAAGGDAARDRTGLRRRLYRGGQAVAPRAVTLRQTIPASDRIYADRAGWIRSEALLRLDLGQGGFRGFWCWGQRTRTGSGPRRDRPARLLWRRVRTVDAALAGMTAAAPGAFSDGQRAALAQWLSHLRAIDGGRRTQSRPMRTDVARYLDFLTRHRGGGAGPRP